MDEVAQAVEVEHDCAGVLVQAAHAHLQKGGFDLARVGGEFVVAVGGPMALFEPRQGGRGGMGSRLSSLPTRSPPFGSRIG